MANPSSAVALLPSVSISVASVLVDGILRSDLHVDRIRIQVILWLAASLQNPIEGPRVTSTWIHLVFLANVMFLSTRAWIVHYRWNTVTEDRPEFVRLIPWSLLVAVLYSFASEIRSKVTWHSGCIAALGSYLLLGAWRLHLHRRRQVKRELIGIPTVMSSASLSTRSVDESNWLDWSPSEVMLWIARLPDDPSAIDWKDVCRTLAPERIPGSALEALHMSDLRSMGVPFGPANCLIASIAALAMRYPDRRSQLYDRSHDMLEAEGWLTADIHRSQKSSGGLETGRSVPVEAMPVPLDASVVQRAHEVMHDRYGLGLPQINTPDSPQEQSTSQGNSLDTCDTRTSTSTLTERAGPFEGLPPELLESMPPNIRDIATRKPDLVRKLLVSKTEQVVPESAEQVLSPGEQVRLQSQTYLKTRLGVQGRSEMARVYSVPSEKPLADDTAVQGELDEVDEDGERTGLLRKRAGRSKYASIR